MIESKSVTFDETIYAVLAQGTRALGAPDPRLATFGVAPLPVWVAHLSTQWNHGRWRYRLTEGLPGDGVRVRRARWIALFAFGVPAIVLVVGWLTRRTGWWAGLAGGLWLAGSPSWIAHGSLATTDAAVALGLLAVAAATAAAWRAPTPMRLILLAVLTGSAIAAKYSAVVGLPLAMLPVARSLWRCDGSWTANTVRVLLGGIAFVALSLAVTWMWHGRGWVEIVERTPRAQAWPLRLPAPLAGMLAQWRHQQRGHAAYLCGEVRTDGWLFYFPVAMFCKSSPPELVSLLAVLVVPPAVLAMRSLRRCRGSERGALPRDLSVVTWTLLSWMVWLGGIASSVQIGHRYLLVLYPLAVLFTVDWLGAIGRRWARWGLAGLVAVQLATSAVASPHYLAYFSPWVGGSAAGHRWLGDSNLDWGQDLPSLKRWCDRHPDARGRIVYFGTASLADEGIAWLPATAEDWKRAERDFDYVAVSVTVLQQIYPPGSNGIQGTLPEGMAGALLGRRPAARAGYSIWIFDLRKQEMLEGSAPAGRERGSDASFLGEPRQPRKQAGS